MNFRPWLEPAVLRQMNGIPDDALDALVSVMADVCDDPRNRLYSAPVRNSDPDERIAELGDHGFIEFTIDEDERLIRVRFLVWTG